MSTSLVVSTFAIRHRAFTSFSIIPVLRIGNNTPEKGRTFVHILPNVPHRRRWQNSHPATFPLRSCVRLVTLPAAKFTSRPPHKLTPARMRHVITNPRSVASLPPEILPAPPSPHRRRHRPPPPTTTQPPTLTVPHDEDRGSRVVRALNSPTCSTVTRTGTRRRTGRVRTE